MIECITVYTDNFKVGKRTYSFDYQVYRNGQLVIEEHYNSSHRRSPTTIKKYLQSGGATEIVLERCPWV